MNGNAVFTELGNVNDHEINNLDESAERDEKLRGRQHLVTSNMS